MAMSVAGDGLFRGAFEGCISGGDAGINKRPYHHKCKCKLHESRSCCSHLPKNPQVSYPVRRSWSENCLALMTAPSSGRSSTGTSPARPSGEIPRSRSQLMLCNLVDQEIPCED